MKIIAYTQTGLKNEIDFYKQFGYEVKEARPSKWCLGEREGNYVAILELSSSQKT